MTNIDPASLSAKLHQWMKEADEAEGNEKGKKDGIFLNSTFERDYVKQHAMAEGMTEAQISAFFNEIDNGKNVEKSATEIMGGNFTLSNKAEKAKKDNVLTIIRNDSVKDPMNLNWDSVVTNVNNALTSKTLDAPEYYKKLQDGVKVVADAVKAYTTQNPIKNRSDVEKLYDKVKKELNLNKKDEFKDFKLDVLKEFVTLAEKSQKAKETNLVEKAYRGHVEKGMSKKDAVKQLKADFKGSYFSDVIKEFVNTVVKPDANSDFLDAIDYVDSSKYTNSRKLRKDAKKALEDPSYVKISNESLKDRLKGKTSSNKAYAKTEIIDDRVEKRKTESFVNEDFYKVLKNDKIFERMVSNELVTPVRDNNGKIVTDEKGNAKYNLTNLSNMIRERVGADLRASTQGKDLYPYDEVENIVKDIAIKSGLPANDVKNIDARKLITMCGFEIIGVNWVRITTDALKSTAISVFGASAGAAMMLASMLTCISDIKNTDIPVSVTVDKSLNLDINLDIGEEAKSVAKFDKKALYMGLDESLWDYIKIEETPTGYHASINRELIEKFNDKFKIEDLLKDEQAVNKAKELAKSIGVAAASQMAINMLIGALTAQRDHETPIINTNISAKTLEEYEQVIDADKKLSPAEKHAVKELAKTFVKDGKWNRDAYAEFLDSGRAAGRGSFLSRDELLRALRKRKDGETVVIKAEEPAKEVKPAEPVKKEETPAVTPKKVDISAEEVPQADKQLEPNYHLANKHTWKGLASLYGAETPAEIKEVYTELKRINGIRPGDNVIPKNLYLPDELFGGQRKMQRFTDDQAKENFIYRNDLKNIRPAEEPISNGTKLGTVKQGSKWKGVKTENGERKETAPIYNTEAEARKAAKDL